MEQNEYLSDRLDDQINWYDKKSIQNQKLFKRLQLTSIVAAASIPFLSGYITETSIVLKIFTGLLGITVAVITAILGIYKSQENWLEFRTTCESLKHEKYLFLTHAEPYHCEQPFQLLVQRVEGLISKENTHWFQSMNKPSEKKHPNHQQKKI
ncbi:MAG: DUF4231 domain-containing protein [Gammaproteobacteria bacterium]|nr:DUF4231 domain-containing protein [Gammaproteobacteria bacterium]